LRVLVVVALSLAARLAVLAVAVFTYSRKRQEAAFQNVVGTC